MTYDFYLNVIKGKAPKYAPTYLPEEEEEVEKFTCTICKYKYASGLIPFAELPESWSCPICGAPKSVFRKTEEFSALTDIILSHTFLYVKHT